MKRIEILRIIQKHNPENIRMDRDINKKIIKEFEEKNLNFDDLHDLHKNYIICQMINNNILRGLWLTDRGKNEIEKYYGIEKENTNLKEKIQELEKEIRSNKSLLRHPLFVGISTAIVTAFLTYIITK